MRPIRPLLAPFALLLAAPSCAAPAPAPALAAVAADPALWVVRDKDTTIYLFGTIHVLKPGLAWFAGAVKRAFDRSDEVRLELIQPETAVAQSYIMKTGLAADGAPALTQQLPAKQQAEFAGEMKALGLPPGAFDRMRPWFAAMNLSVLPLIKLGYDPSNGPEAVITKAAADAHKPVAGLETFEQQIGFFAGLPAAVQLKFLESTIDDEPKTETEFVHMVDRWSHGDPDSLARILNDDMNASPEVRQVLLVNRNRAWAAWIKDRLARPGTVFIAVGAGHLAGSDSVQAQLARLGVRTARVAN